MHEQSNQGRRTNDRNDSSGGGRVGPEMGSGSRREELSTGPNSDRSSGGLHLGLRGVDQVEPILESSPYLQVLQDIHEALISINQTLKNR